MMARAIVSGLPPSAEDESDLSKGSRSVIEKHKASGFPGVPPRKPPPPRIPPVPTHQPPQGGASAFAKVAAVLASTFRVKAPPATVKPNKPQHNRLPLFWGPAPGSPGRPSSDCVAFVSGAVNGLEDKRLQTANGKRLSAFAQRSGESQAVDALLADARLAEWFAKASAAPEPQKRAAGTASGLCKDHSGKRPSVLGSSASQKYTISFRHFKKSFENNEGRDFKQALLSCKLSLPQINLLLETAPDPSNPAARRKLQEWSDSVAKAEEFHRSYPNEPLLEDEAFVLYLASVPDIHQRLQCMLVMKSFQTLLNRIHSDLNVLLDATEMLFTHTRIPTLLQVVLRIGNHLNEGTSMGDRKWFQLATLLKLNDFRGPKRDARSLLYLVACHLGPVVSAEEMLLLQKAAQISVMQPVSSATQIHDIFKLLSEEKQSLMSRRRRNSLLPTVEDNNDRFAEVGREFVEGNRQKFVDLQEDVQRLLRDYCACVEYFGDVASFIPVDRKIDDDQHPGQQGRALGQKRFVHDLFSVFLEFFRIYKCTLDQVARDREREMDETKRREKTAKLCAAKRPHPLNLSEAQESLVAREKPKTESPKQQTNYRQPVVSLERKIVLPPQLRSSPPKSVGIQSSSRGNIQKEVPSPPKGISSTSNIICNSELSLSKRMEDMKAPTAEEKPTRRLSLRPPVFGELATDEKYGPIVAESLLLLRQREDQLISYRPSDPHQAIAELNVYAIPAAEPTPVERRRRESLRAVADFLLKGEEGREAKPFIEQRFQTENLPPAMNLNKLLGRSAPGSHRRLLGEKKGMRHHSQRPLAPLMETPNEGITPPGSPVTDVRMLPGGLRKGELVAPHRQPITSNTRCALSQKQLQRPRTGLSSFVRSLHEQPVNEQAES